VASRSIKPNPDKRKHDFSRGKFTDNSVPNPGTLG